MTKLFLLILPLYTLTCQPSWKVSGDFVRLKIDTLTVLTAQPDSSVIVLSTEKFRHVWNGNSELRPKNLTYLIQRLDSIVQQVSTITGWKPNHPRITVNWYPIPEIKLLKTNQSAFNDMSEPECETHHILNEVLNPAEFSSEIELCFKREFDAIPNKKLKHAFSLFLYPSKTNQSDKLFRLSNFPSLTEIIHPESDWANDHYLTKKAIVHFFDQLHDPKLIYETLTRIQADGNNIPESWLMAWESMRAEHQPNNTTIQSVYLKGFNFAHEGYRGNNGYSSEAAKQSLNELSRLNANAIALIPYGFMAVNTEAAPIYWANRGGSENDESIIYAGNNAKKMGLYVMLKPQLWLRFGKWCGDLKMESEADWLSLEKSYRNWILHYAFIAAENNFDALCIGVELVEFTRARPEFFRQVIKDVRLIYKGEITYNANWYDEFERIPFWDEADFIGISSYFPLSEDSTFNKKAITEKIRQTASKFESVSSSYNRRIVFTEIGFASNNKPWINPHDERQSSVYDSAAQSLCYDLVLNEWSNKSWSGGFLIWKWSTVYEHHDRERVRFFPNAESQNIIKKWFNLL